MRVLSLFLIACSAPAVAPVSSEPVRWPPIVDSHVHLAYYPVADELARHGVLAAVDLAAPETTLGQPAPIAVLAAAP